MKTALVTVLTLLSLGSFARNCMPNGEICGKGFESVDDYEGIYNVCATACCTGKSKKNFMERSGDPHEMLSVKHVCAEPRKKQSSPIYSGGSDTCRSSDPHECE